MDPDAGNSSSQSHALAIGIESGISEKEVNKEYERFDK
jgi:hypothetical protein